MRSRAIAPAAVSRDELPAWGIVSLASHSLPPTLYCRYGELGGVAPNSDRHSCFVGANIVDSIGHRFTQIFIGKVVGFHFHRLASAAIGLSRVLQVAQRFLFFRVDRDGRFTLPATGFDTFRNEFELQNIRAYIINNPSNWINDEYNKQFNTPVDNDNSSL